MCLIAIAWQVHPQHPLVVLANRDEFFARPTEPMHRWASPAGLLAGRDLQAGGTWLGVFNGRFAAVTNVRESPMIEGRTSRGALIVDFLTDSGNAVDWATQLQDEDYSGFNLLLCDGTSLVYRSNRGSQRQQTLAAGVYGLSNGRLDSDWPKVQRLRTQLSSRLEAGQQDIDTLMQALDDRQQPPDHALPQTGVPLLWERKLAPVMIDGDADYGTRAQTVCLLGGDAPLVVERSRQSMHEPFVEQRFTP